MGLEGGHPLLEGWGEGVGWGGGGGVGGGGWGWGGGGGSLFVQCEDSPIGWGKRENRSQKLETKILMPLYSLNLKLN